MTDPRWDALMTKGWGTWPTIRFVEWAMRIWGKAPDRRGVKFLELGCGAGAQLRFLAAEGFDVYGLDGSKAAISAALDLVVDVRRDGYRHWGKHLMHADLTQLTEKFVPHGGDWDCIFDICTLQHLEPADAKRVIAQAVGWLRPGGYIFSMWRMGDATVAEGVPAPWVLHGDAVPDMFPGLALQLGAETVNYADGSVVSHWLIEGRKRS